MVKNKTHIHLSLELLWKPLSCTRHWEISGCYYITSMDVPHKGKQESHENKYQSLTLCPFLMQTWTAAKEKGEASVRLLYVKVPHRECSCVLTWEAKYVGLEMGQGEDTAPKKETVGWLRPSQAKHHPTPHLQSLMVLVWQNFFKGLFCLPSPWYLKHGF